MPREECRAGCKEVGVGRPCTSSGTVELCNYAICRTASHAILVIKLIYPPNYHNNDSTTITVTQATPINFVVTKRDLWPRS
ncbi:hypothetical protein GBAR_LOCUS1084 [Geodia barretti]|uniref:Uncharacterized protein n=1 Tax=Geodia barretti TaxID=519541 RepID=A0AA35QVB4_GEOBA|nr:hypothetical protein GBAR_LOCUS1084 [Geodia barretti]